MEKLADILSGATRPQRRQPQSAASSRPTEARPTVDYKVRSDRSAAEGYRYTEDPPPPEPCPYCGKLLYHYGATFPADHRIFTWFKEPEPCDCPQAAAARAQKEAAERAAEAERRRQEEADRTNARIRKLLKESGLRGRFQTRTFDRYQVDDPDPSVAAKRKKAYLAAKRYADSFAIMLPTKQPNGESLPPQKERNGLFISGTAGTGKTHLAAAIANQLIHGGVPVICMTMIDLLAQIKTTFDRADGATEAEVMRLYEDVPLLIIDDMGTEQPTQWGITKIYAIINARYEAYMPTIVTTNYSGAELIDRMTPDRDDGYTAKKTIERLQETCAGIEMNWPSWRTR